MVKCKTKAIQTDLSTFRHNQTYPGIIQAYAQPCLTLAFKTVVYPQSVTKIVRLVTPPHYSTLVASLPAHFWSWLPGNASLGFAQHCVRGKGGYWVTLSKSNVFLWTFL